MIEDSQYLTKVREQYEDYPYPLRDPEDEKTKFLSTELDVLEKMNYYCFRGQKDFTNFQSLVAGCGTGDTVIFLAEQLRNISGAHVVALDMSEASLKIAKERAEVRKLENITWIHESLLELPRLLEEGIVEQFDFINCSGVLHHLSDPEEGLKALKSVLKPDGAMGLMLYAQYGRTGVYQMQELMRMINQYQPNMQVQVDNTKTVLGHLPDTNWWKKNEHLIYDVRRFGDVGIYDLFLHSQDRAYTIPELYDYVNTANLKIIGFPRWQDRKALDPSFYLREPELIEEIRKLPVMKQQAIGELVSGHIIKHLFYIAAEDGNKASLDNLDNVPFFFGFWDCQANEVFYKHLKQDHKNTKPINTEQLEFDFKPGKYTKNIFRYLDGKHSTREIFDKVREGLDKEISDQDLLDDFKPIFKYFEDLDAMLLRAKSVPVFEPWFEIQKRIEGFYTKK